MCFPAYAEHWLPRIYVINRCRCLKYLNYYEANEAIERWMGFMNVNILFSFGSNRICWSFATKPFMFPLFNLQMDVCLHSLNAVFLLGDASLNCMVIFFWFYFFAYIISLYIPTSNLHLLLNTCRGFQCFDLHILFCGQLYLWFFSGSFMLVFHYGKTEYPIFWLLLSTWHNSVHNFSIRCSRWPYPFLDLSSPYAPLWYVHKFNA